MHMVVVSSFALDNRESFLGCNRIYDLIQPAAYFMRKYLSPVFDTPDDMVVYVVYACPRVSIFILHTGSIS